MPQTDRMFPGCTTHLGPRLSCFPHHPLWVPMSLLKSYFIHKKRLAWGLGKTEIMYTVQPYLKCIYHESLYWKFLQKHLVGTWEVLFAVVLWCSRAATLNLPNTMTLKHSPSCCSDPNHKAISKLLHTFGTVKNCNVNIYVFWWS